MLKLKVVTPAQVLLDDTVENVSVPTTTGMITVLNKHIPLVSTIRHGEMTVRKDGAGIDYAVHRGVVNVRPHREGLTEVIILLEDGEVVDKQDNELRTKALARAKELATEKEEAFEFGHFESLIERELAKVTFTRKKRR